MSYRLTTTDGLAITGVGAEGSPAEFDPLGGNVGLSTPYIVFNPPPIEPEYPTLQQLFEDAPMYINGQRITCNLDGLTIGCGLAFASLSNGSAVPSDIVQFNNTVFGLGLGGSYVEIPGGSTGSGQATITNGTTVNGVVNVSSQSSTFIFVPSFSTISWNPRQTQQPRQQTQNISKKTLEKFHQAVDDALKALEKESCRNLFNRISRRHISVELPAAFRLRPLRQSLPEGGQKRQFFALHAD